MCDYIEGGTWWIVRSIRTLRGLQRAFARQDVACCLYERVGPMFEMGTAPDGTTLLVVQLVRFGDPNDWDLDLSLSEAGMYVEEEFSGEFA